MASSICQAPSLWARILRVLHVRPASHASVLCQLKTLFWIPSGSTRPPRSVLLFGHSFDLTHLVCSAVCGLLFFVTALYFCAPKATFKERLFHFLPCCGLNTAGAKPPAHLPSKGALKGGAPIVALESKDSDVSGPPLKRQKSKPKPKK